MMSGNDWADEKAAGIEDSIYWQHEMLGLDPLHYGRHFREVTRRAIADALRQEREASERRGAAEEFAQFAAGLRLFATKRDVFSQDLLEGIALAIDRQVQRLLAGGKR